MRLILFLLFTLMPLATSLAQYGRVSGTVTNDNRPIPGVNVGVPELKIGSSTDRNGHFKINQVPTGLHRIRISAIGYQTVTREVNVEQGETATLQISLQTATAELDQVIVTGTMRETYVKESPVKVTVVNPVRLQQGKTSANIMDLISSVSGLTTQLNCGVCGTNAIRVNGVEGPNTAVLIDGMPIMGALASVYGLNGISPSIIDQVEVIKGPQSTLYGTEALGGVVNIITKNPANTPSFSAEVYGKSTEETNINLAASPKVGRFRGFVSGDLVRMENYFDQNNDSFNDVAKRSRVALFGKGTLAGPNGNQILNIAAKLYTENRTGGVRDFTDNMRGSDQIYGESIHTNRAEFLAEYRPAGFDQRLRFSGAFTLHDQDSYYGTEHYDARQNISFGQATWDRPLTKDLKLLLGSTLRYQTYNDNTPATSGGESERFIPGVFAQSELSLGTVTLLGGLRLDHHQEHGVVTAPRLSVKYSPSEMTTIRSSTGTGFRVVNVFTEDHAALTGSREVVFAEGLDPEQSRSITASIEHIFPLGTNPLTVSLDGFYTRFSNKIIPDYDQDPNFIVYENLNGFSVTRGFSIDLDHNLTVIPFSYNASFTLMDVFTEENGRRQALNYAPDFIGSFGATYRIPAWDLNIGYTGNIEGPKRMPDNYVESFGRARWSPTYATHNLKLTKEFINVNSENGVGFEAYLSAENIFDYTQGSPLVDADRPFSPGFDTIYTWGPIVGRTISLGARFNLR